MTILLLTSPGCQPCKEMKKRLEGIPYREIDVTEEPELALALGIRSTPTVVWMKAGLLSGAEIEALITLGCESP